MKIKKQQNGIQQQCLKIVSDSANNSRVFEHLKDKINMTNSQVIDKINTKKIENNFSRKFKAKQRQIVNQICIQMREKLQGILQRQTANVLKKYNANENLKVLDYINGRTQVMNQVGKSPYEWYDEEEHYLDNMHEALTEYCKRI